MEYVQVILIASLVALILLLLTRISNYDTENFDTYWNHSLDAQKQLKTYDNPMHRGNHSLDDSELIAKYIWSEKNIQGEQLHDKHYKDHLREHAWQLPPGADVGFDFRDVINHNPLYTIAMGQRITLAQKTR